MPSRWRRFLEGFLTSRTPQGADADAAPVRALAAERDFRHALETPTTDMPALKQR